MSVLDTFRLDGKVALVTGASKGLGRAIAVAYAQAGADVALAARNLPELEQVAREVKDLGRRALVVPVEVTDLAEIQTMVDRAGEHFGHLDVLVNAAGINRRQSVLEITPADWDFVINTNLRSVFFACQAAGRLMAAQKRGKIVNFASTNAYRSLPDLSLYALTKAAVVRLTASLAVEWAPYNIQVNAIAPGWIDTPMTASMAPERRRWVDVHVPRGHSGKPHNITGAALYLASAASDYATGQTLVVDGGFIAGSPWDCPSVEA